MDQWSESLLIKFNYQLLILLVWKTWYLVVPDVFSKDHIEQMRKELDGYIERRVIKFVSLFQGSACSVKDQRH